jgi:hypothetical protein
MEGFLEKYHSLIFTSIMAIGLEVIAFLYNLEGAEFFIITSTLLLGVFAIEAYLSLQFAREMKSKLPLPHIAEDMKHIHVSHHIILPLFLYLGIFGFIFFNKFSLTSEIIILLGCVTFFGIFQGQRTSFMKEFGFDDTLHYIYDAIKIIIYFLAVDIILQSQIYFSFNQVVTFALVETAALILFMLIIVRKNQFNTGGFIYIFLSSTLLAGLSIFIAPHLNILVSALLSAVFFYLLIGFIHHKLNATLTPAIIVEYLLIAAIILLVIRGISY